MAFLMALLMNDATGRGFNWVIWESYTSANLRNNQRKQKPALSLISLTYIFRYFFHWKFTRVSQLGEYISLEFPHFSLPLGSLEEWSKQYRQNQDRREWIKLILQKANQCQNDQIEALWNYTVL